MRKNRAALLLACLFWGGALLAQPAAPIVELPETAPAVTAARQALERRDYARVIAIYRPYDVNALAANSLYRLAIAYQKTGEFDLANVMLKRATTLNPKGTFASSPERLAVLRQDIANSLPNILPVGSALAASDAGNAAVASTHVAVTRSEGDIKNGLSKWSDFLLAPHFVIAVGALCLIFAIFAVIAGFIYLQKWLSKKSSEKKTSSKKSSGNTVSVVTDVTDDRLQLKAFRDQTALLIAGFEAAGQTDAAMYVALMRLLPLVEREVGRSHISAGNTPTALTSNEREFLTALPKIPLKLSVTSPLQIQQLFQGPRLA
jgi:hypothetical protein